MGKGKNLGESGEGGEMRKPDRLNGDFQRYCDLGVPFVTRGERLSAARRVRNYQRFHGKGGKRTASLAVSGEEITQEPLDCHDLRIWDRQRPQAWSRKPKRKVWAGEGKQ